MPRGRSSSSSRSSYGSQRQSSSFRSPPPQNNKSTMPQQTQQSMPMQPQSGGMMGGIGSTIVTGMALGAGSEIGHQAVRSLIGGGSHHGNEPIPQNNQTQTEEVHETNTNNLSQKQSLCSPINQRFVECLKKNGNDISDCQNLFNDLKSCEKGM